jgi:hypothetical protein
VDAVACWLAPRRLVTTELFVRRPEFQPIWVTVGIEMVAGLAIADVRQAVRQAVADFLSPLPDPSASLLDDQVSLLATPQYSAARRGWRLRKAVAALELMFVVGRVPGVAWVNGVRLAKGSDAETQDRIAMTGLQLPRLVDVAVDVGDAPPMTALRGTQAPAERKAFVAVPVVPEECG